MIKNFLFSLSILFSSVSLAQVPLNKGEPAPEDGIFLTNLEAAKILAEREASAELLKIELEEQEAELSARCEGEKKLKDLYLSAEKQKNREIIDLKKQQIKNLTTQLEETEGYEAWWLAGGIVVGAASSIAIFFAATQIQQTPSLLGQ